MEFEEGVIQDAIENTDKDGIDDKEYKRRLKILKQMLKDCNDETVMYYCF